jgi:hypothetical protein
MLLVTRAGFLYIDLRGGTYANRIINRRNLGLPCVDYALAVSGGTRVRDMAYFAWENQTAGARLTVSRPRQTHQVCSEPDALVFRRTDPTL